MNRLMQISNHMDIALDAKIVRYCDKSEVVMSVLNNPRKALEDSRMYIVHNVSFIDGVSVFWGHYDLTFEEAVDSFNYKASY